MSLRKPREKTPAQLEANRRNALKSTGPRTRRGKAISAGNSFYHGAYARPDRQTRDHMTQLGDDYDLLARLTLDLTRSWRPQNAMQALIVADLAKLFWKKTHLERTVFASRLVELARAEVEHKMHQLDPDGPDEPTEASDVEISGFRGVTNSLEAFAESLRLLGRFLDVIRNLNWTADISAIATPLYGKRATPKGREILNLFSILAQADTRREAMEVDAYCVQLVNLIRDEQASVLMQQAHLRYERRAEFRDSRGSHWVPTAGLWGIALAHDAQLDRLIEAKTKLLIRLQGLRPLKSDESADQSWSEPGQEEEEKTGPIEDGPTTLGAESLRRVVNSTTPSRSRGTPLLNQEGSLNKSSPLAAARGVARGHRGGLGWLSGRGGLGRLKARGWSRVNDKKTENLERSHNVLWNQ